MAIIQASTSSGRPIVTLINVFHVQPRHQATLVALLNEATEQVMRHLDGFISASIHQGIDGHHVTNYAQWESLAHFAAMQKNPEAQSHMKRAAELATSVEPAIYEVAASIESGNEALREAS